MTRSRAAFVDRSRRRRIATLGLLLATGCGSGSDAPKPDAEPVERLSTILITLDTTRADALGAFGGRPDVTPHLDALAGQSVLYERGFTVAPLTLPSHASMLTGLYPLRHGVRDNGLWPLPEEATTLAEAARDAGYETAAFVAAVVLARTFGLAQGFDRYDEPSRVLEESSSHFAERPASEMVDGALAWLSERDGERPFFLWLHLFDAHTPHDPPEAFRGKTPSAYLDEVAAMDAEIGRFVAGLRARGALEESLVLVVADHGESLLEHGEPTHGPYCYQSTIHVPFFVRYPDGFRAGERSRQIVSVVDVHPTMREAMGIRAAIDIDGSSLYRRQAREDRGVYFESYYGYLGSGWSPIAGWADREGKYVHSSEPALFDLDADPGETTNLADERRDLLARHRESIEALAARRTLARGTAAPDPALREAIANLGYAGGSDAEVELPHPLADTGLPGPLASAAEHRQLMAAQRLYNQGDFATAESHLREIVATNPRNVAAHSRLGLSLMRQQRHAEAIEPLTYAIQHGPPRSDRFLSLGICERVAGRRDEAVMLFRRALELDPDSVLTLGHLAATLDQAGRPDEAVGHKARFFELTGKRLPDLEPEPAER